MSTADPNPQPPAHPPDDRQLSDPSAETAHPQPPTTEQQWQELIAQRDANWEKYLRAEAELDNYRRRGQKERDEERRFACLGLIRDLLPALDNLQRAIDAGRAAQQNEATASLLQGVEMVLRQVEDVLARYGAQPIQAVGEPFDPNRHEALQQVPTPDHPPLTVLEEVERGFTLHERVIRPSKVLVAAPPAENPPVPQAPG